MTGYCTWNLVCNSVFCEAISQALAVLHRNRIEQFYTVMGEKGLPERERPVSKRKACLKFGVLRGIYCLGPGGDFLEYLV